MEKVKITEYTLWAPMTIYQKYFLREYLKVRWNEED